MNVVFFNTACEGYFNVQSVSQQKNIIIIT